MVADIGASAESGDVGWFRQARFGMFVHWGMYALLKRGEQVLFREHLTPSEYRGHASDFRAERFDPNQWADVAVRAGMKYAVLTTKHHDGYCLFDSQVSDFTAPKVGPGRDLIGEYVSAMRSAGLRVGLYYSLPDWSKPAYFEGPDRNPEGYSAFVDYLESQVRELCTNYGRIDVMWFDDTPARPALRDRAASVEAMIRELQPGILINNRSGLRGDFDTPEQRIVASGGGRPWESCMTSTDRWWGYHKGDYRYKSPREIVCIVAKTSSGGGNLLYNVGPKADGSLPEPFVDSVLEVGGWLARNGEAVYGTEGCDLFELTSIGHMTRRGNTLYVLVLFWSGADVNVAGLKTPVKSARLLATGESVKFSQSGDRLTFYDLAASPPDRLCTVIAIDLEGEPEVYDWTKQRLWRMSDPSVYAEWARR